MYLEHRGEIMELDRRYVRKGTFHGNQTCGVLFPAQPHTGSKRQSQRNESAVFPFHKEPRPSGGRRAEIGLAEYSDVEWEVRRIL